jgi:hypothetical protein
MGLSALELAFMPALLWLRLWQSQGGLPCGCGSFLTQQAAAAPIF